MSNVEEKLAKSLTAESTELIPYLPPDIEVYPAGDPSSPTVSN